MRASLVVVAAFVALAVPSVESVATSPAAARPNIVLILSDDQRWDTLWAMRTVEEAIAADGVTFTNSFVVNPLCCPSRASILTGKYSHSTGVYLNDGPDGGFTAFDDAVTIATVLQQAGYTTGLFGKYLNGYGSKWGDYDYVPPGWDRWLAFVGGQSYYDYTLTDGYQMLRHGHLPGDYSTAVLATAVTRFLDTADQPFFAVFAPFAVHAPAVAPPGHAGSFQNFDWWPPQSFNERDLSDKPRYIRALGSLTRMQAEHAARFRKRQLAAGLGVDDAVRSILTTLGRRHVVKQTMIAYASDNGVAWGEHPLIAARKVVPYEEPIRVPLVIRYDPLTRRRERNVGRLVLNIDLAPTFAAVAGTTMPGAEGRSLVPLLAGRRTSWRRDVLVEHEAGPPEPRVPAYCAVRTASYKYVRYQTGEEELYNLARDPHELHNRARKHSSAAVKGRLRNRLAVLCRPRPPGFTVRIR
jgi:arylsulfatase A-like enzyme